MIKQIKKCLKDAGISVTNVAMDGILLLSFPRASFLDLMILQTGVRDKTLWAAEYHSEPIELTGLYLPVFYMMANTLNERGHTSGKWSFIVSEGNGYFVYNHRFHIDYDVISKSPEILSYTFCDLERSVSGTVSDQVLSIYRLVDIVKRDRGLGNSMTYALTLTTNAGFEESLQEEEKLRLLILQEKVEKEDYEVNSEDEHTLIKLYESQINAIHEEGITARTILFRNLRRVFLNLRKLP